MYRSWRVPNAGSLTTVVLKQLTEDPVNGGRNYNGPKVAKFLGAW
jgi:hypothetical protein